MTAPHDPYRRPADEPSGGTVYGSPRPSPGYGPNNGNPPPYGQQPYAQQPYGTQPYGQQPYETQWQPGGQLPPHGAMAGPGAYGAPPPKKSGAGKIIGIVAAIVVGVCVLGSVVGALNGGDDTTATVDTADASTAAPAAAAADDPAPSAADEPVAEAPADTITFKVTGGGSAMLTWIDGSFQTSQDTKPLPWSKSIEDKGTPGVNIVAQRKSGDSGTISCQILRGDEVVTENSSSGPYAVVTCVLG